MRRNLMTESMGVNGIGNAFGAVLDRVNDDDRLYLPLNNDKFSAALFNDGLQDAIAAFSDDIRSVPNNKVLDKLSKLSLACTRKEEKIRPQLEVICYNAAVTLFNIPSGVLEMDLSLVDEIEPLHQFHIWPDETDTPYESVESMRSEDKEVEKRKLCNMIVMGATDYLFPKAMKIALEELYDLDESLPYLYSKLMKLNKYALYTNDIVIDDKNHCQTGYSDVHIGNDENLTSIEVRATSFPVLLFETIKGLLDIVASNSLPDDVRAAEHVINKADILLQEPLNMCLGKPLFLKMTQGMNINPKDIPTMLEYIFKADADSLIGLFDEIAHNTNRGRKIMTNIVRSVEKHNQYDEFVGNLMQRDEEKQIIDEINN